VLVGINDFHGSFEAPGQTRLNLSKCAQRVNKVRALR
jgi:hypothetical protein